MDYDEMLDRALEETPDLDGSGVRFELPEPVTRTEGHFTVYENFKETASELNRDPSDVMSAVQDELGTNAELDEKSRLRLTGDFDTRKIRNAIDAYAEAYVLCDECGLPDTRMETHQGVEVVRCEACGAHNPPKSN